MHRSPQSVFLSLLILAAAAASGFTDGRAAEPQIDYVRDIKPIFLKHCASCHGGLKQSGGLRLDTASAMLTGGESGAAIVAGDAESSLLVEVLRGDAGFTMPPDGQGTPPNAANLARIRRWIEQGAKAPQNERPQADPETYWSYQRLAPVEVPNLPNSEWVANPIDAFVATKHAAQGLQAQPPAPPQVLLRRLYLDLVGYPPSRDALQRFLADPSDSAYEAIVDDLLARPQYGERWGRHWMDVWRYSDWYGRRPNNEIRYGQRHIWRWRDWIIQSLNEDKGYDRMITEMLAGDELAPLDHDVLPATGFLGRNWYKFDKNTWLFETVEQTSRGLMAMTIQCCRCHDHKYDPLPQQAYYELRAFFEPHGFRTDPMGASAKLETDNGKEQVLSDGLSRAYDQDPAVATYLFQRGDDRSPDTDHPLSPAVPAALGTDGLHIAPVPLPPEAYMPQITKSALARSRRAADVDVAAAKKARDDVKQEITRMQEQLVLLENADVAYNDEPFLQESFDQLDPKRWTVASGSWSISEGYLQESDIASFATLVTTQNHPRNFTAKVRYRKRKPGTYRSVGFSFDRINGGRDSQDVYTSRADGRPQGSVQAFHRIAGKQTYPKAGIQPAAIKVGEWIDLEFQVRETQLTIRLNGEVKLEYTLPVARREGKFAIWVHQGTADFDHLHITPLFPTIPELKESLLAAQHQLQLADLAVQSAVAKAAWQQAQIDAERVRLGVHPGDAVATALAAHRAELTLPLLEATSALARAERQVRVTDSQANRAQRDAAKKKHEAAAQRVADANGQYTRLKSFPAQSTGRRLALARWLTRPDHPRTARVAVNHIWMRHFGEALVPSTDNFGLSGKLPSHPQLLDWLAGQLVAGGWGMKPLHKLIVMSNTYRLASGPSTHWKANQTIDPENIYLWRANTRRAEAEVVRDSMLAVSNTMDWTQGGPDIEESQGQTTRRRSLYFRTTPDNQMQMLALFDQANPDECYRRQVSVIPQQALALMNGQLAIDLSRQLAGQLTAQVGGPSADSNAEFIQLAFETILTRPPTPDEKTACITFLGQTANLFRNGKALNTFPASPEKPTVAPSADPPQRARENLIHVLFNHHEFVTVR